MHTFDHRPPASQCTINDVVRRRERARHCQIPKNGFWLSPPRLETPTVKTSIAKETSLSFLLALSPFTLHHY